MLIYWRVSLFHLLLNNANCDIWYHYLYINVLVLYMFVNNIKYETKLSSCKRLRYGLKTKMQISVTYIVILLQNHYQTN